MPRHSAIVLAIVTAIATGCSEGTTKTVVTTVDEKPGAVEESSTGGLGDTTDVSKGVESINKELLSDQGVRLDCPTEVTGGNGALFTCTISNTRTDKRTELGMKVANQHGVLAVDIADEKEFRKALQTIGAR